MEKPFTIKIIETEQKIVEIINNSQLPAYVLKSVLQGLYSQIEKLDNEEIQKYQESVKKEYEDKQKKESDK